MRLLAPSIAATALALLGCASATPKRTITSNEPMLAKWTGAFQPTQQRSGALQVSGQNKAAGNITMTTADGSLQRMRVQLMVSTSLSNVSQLRWAVLPGRCGSGDLPLIGFEQFPLIEVSANGRGTAEGDLPIQLDGNGSYHANVYNGGQQIDNVVTCANLKYEAVAPK